MLPARSSWISSALQLHIFLAIHWCLYSSGRIETSSTHPLAPHKFSGQWSALFSHGLEQKVCLLSDPTDLDIFLSSHPAPKGNVYITVMFLDPKQVLKEDKDKPLVEFNALLKDISTAAVFSYLHQAGPRIWPANLGLISSVYHLCFRPDHQMQHPHVEFQQSRICEGRWTRFTAFGSPAAQCQDLGCGFVTQRS